MKLIGYNLFKNSLVAKSAYSLTSGIFILLALMVGDLSAQEHLALTGESDLRKIAIPSSITKQRKLVLMMKDYVSYASRWNYSWTLKNKTYEGLVPSFLTLESLDEKTFELRYGISFEEDLMENANSNLKIIYKENYLNRIRNHLCFLRKTMKKKKLDKMENIDENYCAMDKNDENVIVSLSAHSLIQYSEAGAKFSVASDMTFLKAQERNLDRFVQDINLKISDVYDQDITSHGLKFGYYNHQEAARFELVIKVEFP